MQPVAFLAFRCADMVECFSPVALAMPPVPGRGGEQLRLIGDDGYAGPVTGQHTSAPGRQASPRQRSMKASACSLRAK